MILVVGATGILGGMIARCLLDLGQGVRVLLRPDSPSLEMAERGMATAAESLIAAGARPVYGDLKQQASLQRAVQGVHTVISSANSARRGGEDNVQNVDREGNRRLIAAAAEAGVAHFIFVSALGASVFSASDFMRAKAETEHWLRLSGLTYTIVSPTAFMDSWPGRVVGLPALQGRPVTLVGEERRRHSFVSCRDVAAFTAAMVDNPQAYNEFLAIGGPQALSWRDVVEIYGRVLGREIPVNWVQPGERVPGLPGPMCAVLAAQERYNSTARMADLATRYGITLTTLEDFARQQVGELLSGRG